MKNKDNSLLYKHFGHQRSIGIGKGMKIDTLPDIYMKMKKPYSTDNVYIFDNGDVELFVDDRKMVSGILISLVRNIKNNITIFGETSERNKHYSFGDVANFLSIVKIDFHYNADFNDIDKAIIKTEFGDIYFFNMEDDRYVLGEIISIYF